MLAKFKIKPIVVIFISILFILLSVNAKAMGYSQNKTNAMVRVSLPNFKVSLNGREFDSENNMYPLIVYKDITYFPMTYRYSKFLALNVNWHPINRLNNTDKGVLFIGASDENVNELEIYDSLEINKRYYNANIVDYDLALNTINPDRYLSNKDEEYPILNFRDITYFPLTWKFSVDEFGWTYSFNEKDGLIINSSSTFRPVIDDGKIASTSPNRGIYMDYFYGDNYYIGLPTDTMGMGYNFIIRKRGEDEKVYNLEKGLNGEKFNYKFSLIDVNEPKINGDVFSMKAFRYGSDSNDKILFEIDLKTGEIIRKEILE